MQTPLARRRLKGALLVMPPENGHPAVLLACGPCGVPQKQSRPSQSKAGHPIMACAIPKPPTSPKSGPSQSKAGHPKVKRAIPKRAIPISGPSQSRPSQHGRLRAGSPTWLSCPPASSLQTRTTLGSALYRSERFRAPMGPISGGVGNLGDGVPEEIAGDR